MNETLAADLSEKEIFPIVDEKGNVIGLCSTEELRRRINDPNYMPEIKAMRRKLAQEDAMRKTKMVQSWSESKKEELRQEWLRHIQGTK